MFGAFLFAFGLLLMNGVIFKYFAAQRRTEHGIAEIVNVKQIAGGAIGVLLPSFEVTYRFTVESEMTTTSNNYDVDPTGRTIAVVYEPAKPKNCALLLPSKELRGLTIIAIALIMGGGWLIQRNISKKTVR